MKILPELNSNNIMLVNFIYHYGRKENSYNDYLDIVYKDLKTGEKHVETIENPEMEIYFAKEEVRDYDYNKSFMPLEDCVMHTCKYKDIPFYIAKQAGDEYVKYLMNAIHSGNRYAMKNIHKYKYVFGSDYEIENWYRIQWLLNNDNDKEKPITKQYLDIEVDTIDIPGFPRDGECPINIITIVDETTKSVYSFILRNDKNPLIKEFENQIDSIVDEMHESFDDVYGELKYLIYMYDDERNLIIDAFKLINTIKPDFTLIWNGFGFDIPYIIARIKELGMDPLDIFCHKDFPIKEVQFKKDTINFQVKNKSDSLKVSSYTIFQDQMEVYAGLRKGQPEERSYALNAIATKEIGDEKLDYSEDANIKTLPYVDFKKFYRYNVKDALLQMGIEHKTNDLDNLYQRSYSNATSFSKIFRQTV